MLNAMQIIPAKRRVFRKKQLASSTTSLTLLSAVYDPTGEEYTLTLTFDQPISLDGFDPTQIVLKDGQMNDEQYIGKVDPAQPSANVLVINLEFLDTYTGTGVTMDATGSTGIFGTNGNPWAGVNDFQVQS